MVAKITITRTATDGNAPVANSLVPGQLAVEMGTPTRLWVGVPPAADPTGQKLLLDLSTPPGGAGTSDIPPAMPVDGQLWWDSTSGTLYVYYDDGTSSQWVPAAPSAGGTDEPIGAGVWGRLETSAWERALPIAGGNMTGALTLAGPPTLPLHAATMAYSDLHLELSGGTLTGNLVAQAAVTINGPTVTTSSVTHMGLPTVPQAGGLLWNNAGIVNIGVGAAPVVGGAETSDTPPANPTDGALWWDSASGVLYVYYDDGTSQQWIPASPQGVGGSAFDEPVGVGAWGRLETGLWQNVLPLAGGALTGPLSLAGDALTPLQAVPKQQLDAAIAGVGGGMAEPVGAGAFGRTALGAWESVLPLTGGTLTGTLTVGTLRFIEPTADTTGMFFDTALQTGWHLTRSTNTLKLKLTNIDRMQFNPGTIDIFYPITMGGVWVDAKLTVKSTYTPNGAASLDLVRPMSGGARIRSYSDASLRWQLDMATDTPDETGGNSGSNFALQRFSDTGVLIDKPIEIPRSTGIVDFAFTPTVLGVPIGGGGGMAEPVGVGTWGRLETGVWSEALPIAGGTLTGNTGLVISPTASMSPTIDLCRQNFNAARIRSFRNNSSVMSLRWELALGNAVSESGANYGANFTLTRYTDTGTLIDIPFEIERFGSGKAYIRTSEVTIQGTNNYARLNLIKGASGMIAQIVSQTGASARWVIEMGDSQAEVPGSNSGSAFNLRCFHDDGTAPVPYVFRANRNTGTVDFTTTPTVLGIPIGGGGAAMAEPVGAGAWGRLETGVWKRAVEVDGDVMTGTLSIDHTSGNFSEIAGKYGGVNRWRMRLGSDDFEGGGNMGSKFTLARCNDAGTSNDVVLSIERQQGFVTITSPWVTINSGAFAADLMITRPAGQSASITYTSAGSTRWQMGASNAAEGGANAGSNFQILRYSDTAGFIDTPLSIDRATGVVNFAFRPTVVGVPIVMSTEMESMNALVAALTARVAALEGAR